MSGWQALETVLRNMDAYDWRMGGDVPMHITYTDGTATQCIDLLGTQGTSTERLSIARACTNDVKHISVTSFKMVKPHVANVALPPWAVSGVREVTRLYNPEFHRDYVQVTCVVFKDGDKQPSNRSGQHATT